MRQNASRRRPVIAAAKNKYKQNGVWVGNPAIKKRKRKKKEKKKGSADSVSACIHAFLSGK